MKILETRPAAVPAVKGPPGSLATPLGVGVGPPAPGLRGPSFAEIFGELLKQFSVGGPPKEAGRGRDVESTRQSEPREDAPEESELEVERAPKASGPESERDRSECEESRERQHDPGSTARTRDAAGLVRTAEAGERDGESAPRSQGEIDASPELREAPDRALVAPEDSPEETPADPESDAVATQVVAVVQDPALVPVTPAEISALPAPAHSTEKTTVEGSLKPARSEATAVDFLEPGAAPVEPEATPVESKSTTPVEPAATPVEPKATPVEPKATKQVEPEAPVVQETNRPAKPEKAGGSEAKPDPRAREFVVEDASYAPYEGAFEAADTTTEDTATPTDKLRGPLQAVRPESNPSDGNSRSNDPSRRTPADSGPTPLPAPARVASEQHADAPLREAGRSGEARVVTRIEAPLREGSIAETRAAEKSARDLAAGSPGRPAHAGSLDDEAIARIVRMAKVTRQGEKVAARVWIRPPELGSVKVSVTVVKGLVTAELRVENEAARQAIANQLSELSKALEEGGMKVAGLSVELMGGGLSKEPERDVAKGVRVRARGAASGDGQSETALPEAEPVVHGPVGHVGPTSVDVRI